MDDRNVSVSIFLTITIVMLLAFSSSASAVQVTTSTATPSTVTKGETTTFTTTINIQTDERIPIERIEVSLSGPTSETIRFDVDGTVTSGQAWVDVTRISPSPNTGYGYGYRTGYGYGYQTGYGYRTGYGYFGYGYGYTGTGVSPTLKYQIQISTDPLPTGTYDVTTAVATGQPTTFQSSTVTFTITEKDQPQLEPIGGFENAPMDPDGDGKFEDVNGDGSVDFFDALALFLNRQDPVVQNNVAAFDFNDDGTVNVGDAQALFAKVGDSDQPLLPTSAGLPLEAF